MISSKKLIKMARKWQKLAAIGRKRIPILVGTETEYGTSCSSSVAEKGHFVVYTTDRKHFVFPTEYLYSYIIRELFVMSEEEFGIPSDGPITLPCDAAFIKHGFLNPVPHTRRR